MQANRSRDTRPEIALRQALHRMGLRYRVCARPLRNVRHTADIVFGPAKVAVEVRGCFWHGCPEHYRAPAANKQFWADKVARNMARDVATARQLGEAGWLLVVVWEHDDVATSAAQIANVVQQRRKIPTESRRGESNP